jgi:type II secretory pathway pseudopilin PulG
LKKQIVGFSLVELIVFIVVIGITIPSIVSVLSLVLKNTNKIQQQSSAIQSANQCLEWFLNTRYKQNFAAIVCPSSSVPAFCSVPNGYTISVNVTCLTKYGDLISNYKQITVSVNGLGNATNSLIVANY